jgi:hypothetical protein
MAFVRAGCLVLLATCLLFAPRPAGAESLEACAQRVIRDWYSGGRVDRVYPLPCYRAAIRSLPDDVLQYSNADRDIARALAYARQGRTEPNHAPAASKEPARASEERARRPASSAQAPTEGPATVPPERSARGVRRPDLPVGLASGPQRATASASLPYPVIGLAVLAGVLLLTGGLGWLTARRR